MKYIYQSSIGKIKVVHNKEAILEVSITNEEIDSTIKSTDLIESVKGQLDKYLKGNIKDFDIPLDLQGTDFMKKVWNELLKIPYGKVATYKEIAERIGNPKAVRAVGMACNRNPIMIIVPCHRVVGSNGKLVGYEYGLTLKEKLLKMEKNYERR